MLLNIALSVLSLPVLAWTVYLAVLAILSRASVPPSTSAPAGTNFDIIVPAHDEESGIARTVESLLATDYPTAMRRVIVVADNCTDRTEARAQAAGAAVITRDDPSRRGKGHALAFAFERSLRERFAGALVVVDADTRVTANLLRAFDARLRGGAAAVQAEYCVANPDASWRTRLMHVAFTLFHDVRSRARDRLGVSTGLRGNGMAFSAALLEEVPHEAFSLVEDVEYGIRLGLAGRRVEYAGDARVYGDMVSTEVASRSQRRRWEGGRWALAKRYAPLLVRLGLQRRDRVLLDLAADLLVPPLTYVAVATASGAALAGAWLLLGRGVWWSVAPWCIAASALVVYVVRGAWLARLGPRVILDALWVPAYLVWKILLALRPLRTPDGEWVRTARPETGESSSKRLTIGTLPVDPVTRQGALERVAELVSRAGGGVVFTPNVDHVVIAEKHVRFRDAYARADLSLADGVPLLWAARLLGRPLPEKVSGSDFVPLLLERAAERGWRVYLLGGAPGVAALARDKLLEWMPSLQVVGVDAPRIEPGDSPELRDLIVERIRAASPDIVLVALGAPKQELWIDEVRDTLRPAVLLGVGASLDFVAGTVVRAPRWMSNAGFEWLFRLNSEPRRLWRRYLVRDPKFLFILGRALGARATGAPE